MVSYPAIREGIRQRVRQGIRQGIRQDGSDRICTTAQYFILPACQPAGKPHDRLPCSLAKLRLLSHSDELALLSVDKSR